MEAAKAAAIVGVGIAIGGVIGDAVMSVGLSLLIVNSTTSTTTKPPAVTTTTPFTTTAPAKVPTTAQERKDYIWNYLKNNLTDNNEPISDMHTAAIMGNMSVETGSSFDPMNAQDDYGWPGSNNPEYIDEYAVKDSVGWGLLQWTYYTRKQGLLDYADGMGKSVGDIDVQLGFLLYEVTQDSYYSNQYQKFLNTQDKNSATEFFCSNIEQAGTPHLDMRQQAAQSIFEEYTGR